jgi:Carboxypeptidase regulatory-like domain
MSPHVSRFTIAACSLLSVSTFAFGQNASIEANLKGADGQPAKNAQVQVDSLDKKAKAIVVKTDANGHAVVTKLEAGSYRVSAVVGGKVQSSQKVKVDASKPAVVAIKVANASSTTAVPAGAKTKIVGHKRYVWVPGQTGSRFGGYWKEAGTADLVQDANGNVTTASGDGMDNIQKQTRSSTRNTSGSR